MEQMQKRLVADGHVTVTEAARFLDLSRSAVYSLMERGELPYVKFGRARRVPKRGLIEFAASMLRGAWKTGTPDTKE